MVLRPQAGAPEWRGCAPFGWAGHAALAKLRTALLAHLEGGPSVIAGSRGRNVHELLAALLPLVGQRRLVHTIQRGQRLAFVPKHIRLCLTHVWITASVVEVLFAADHLQH